MELRRIALEWWNNFSSAEKTRLCDINTELVGYPRRWESLSGSEIQKIYENEQNNTRVVG